MTEPSLESEGLAVTMWGLHRIAKPCHDHPHAGHGPAQPLCPAALVHHQDRNGQHHAVLLLRWGPGVTGGLPSLQGVTERGPCSREPAVAPDDVPLPPFPSAAAFAYLMMERYLDAVKCLNFILGYIAKCDKRLLGSEGGGHTRSSAAQCRRTPAASPPPPHSNNHSTGSSRTTSAGLGTTRF